MAERPESRGPVVVVGDVVTDVTARLAEPPAARSDAAAAVTLGGGGSAANVACWLAGEGVETHLVARVGDDPLAATRAAELAAAGVHRHLVVDPGRSTGAIVVIVDPHGDRTMLTDRGANLALAPGDIPDGLIARAAWLHLSGYTLLDGGSRPAALAVLDTARAAGVPVSVDPSSARPLERTGPRRFLDWTADAAAVLPNLAEARLLSGAHDAAEAARRLGARYAEAVVTLGGDGCVWSDGSGVLGFDAEQVKVVDTTGAGDAFAAGFVAASVSGAPPAERCRRALALAARAVTRVGARP